MFTRAERENHESDTATNTANSYEYPNKQGLGCNVINDNDTSNFLTFLQELRKEPAAANLTFTAAGSLFPWNDATGAQSADVSGFASVLDYIMIMVSTSFSIPSTHEQSQY